MLWNMYIVVGLIVMTVVILSFIARELASGADGIGEVVMVTMMGIIVGMGAGIFWPLVAFGTLVVVRGNSANRRRGYHDG